MLKVKSTKLNKINLFGCLPSLIFSSSEVMLKKHHLFCCLLQDDRATNSVNIFMPNAKCDEYYQTVLARRKA